jgi:alpha-tubulin suppressor-like RCC1 family protein
MIIKLSFYCILFFCVTKIKAQQVDYIYDKTSGGHVYKVYSAQKFTTTNNSYKALPKPVNVKNINRSITSPIKSDNKLTTPEQQLTQEEIELLQLKVKQEALDNEAANYLATGFAASIKKETDSLNRVIASQKFEMEMLENSANLKRRIAGSFENAGLDTAELKLIYFAKMTNYEKGSDSKAAIRCHDSLLTYLKKINLADNSSYHNKLTATAYFYEGNYLKGMQYLTNGPEYIFDRKNAIYPIVTKYWEAYEQLPEHKEFLDSIITLCLLANKSYEVENILEIQKMSRWSQVELGEYENAELTLTRAIEYFEKGNSYNASAFYKDNSYYYRAYSRYKMGKYTDAKQDIINSLKYNEAIGATKANALLLLMENSTIKSVVYETKPAAVINAQGHHWINVELGRDFIFATDIDGSIWGWAKNGFKQLDLETKFNKGNMLKVAESNDWKNLKCALGTAVILKSDGSLWSCGLEVEGEVYSSALNWGIAQAGNGKDWVNISAGHFHTMLIKANGTLWEFNRSGPLQFGSEKKWVKVFCGRDFTFATKKDGTLWGWGRNEYGQLGIGSTTKDESMPVKVDDGHVQWKDITCGYDHVVALKEDGTLWAWGANEDGQLGIGNTIFKNVPVQVGTDNTWIHVSAGDSYTLAIKKDGSLWAWGNNDHGELGIDNLETQHAPLRVGKDQDWEMVFSGKVYKPTSISVAIKSDGTIWMWGSKVKWVQ